MSEQLQTLSSKSVSAKIILISTIIFAVVFAWFAVRWQIGDMLAELTAPNDANAGQSAEAAKNLAPHDPLANWLAASVGKSENAPAAFADVVRLAPRDFRWRVELARAFEQAGDNEKAEQSFKRAVELAPAYAYPHWQTGNFYLRQNRSAEAFAEFKKAAVGNDVYPEQIFAIAWDYYEKDTAKLGEFAGDAAAKKSLVKFYFAKNRPADALAVFNSLTETERQNDVNFTKFIADISFQKRFFRSSVEFARQSVIDADAKAETMTNGGFEKEIAAPEATYFNWKLTTAEKLDIKTDATQKHEGNRSLRVVFSGFAESYLGGVRQIAAVQPNAKYRLSFWAQTENLRSAGMPNIEIINANDDKLIAASKVFSGSSEWQESNIEFAAPENCEGVTVKIGREFCGTQCAIYGTLRLDDFRLTKR